jgi:parallel beta-helix repeat protein
VLTAYGSVYPTVNGEEIGLILLSVGESYAVEVMSGDLNPHQVYVDYSEVVPDNFSSVATMYETARSVPASATTENGPNITDGLIGYWPMDDYSGTVVTDRSGRDNDGVLSTSGLPVWQPSDGRVNGALLFDGSGGYVNCGNNSVFNLTNAATVMAWIKVNEFTRNWQAILTKGDSAYRLHRHTNTNYINFACNGLSGGNKTWGSTVWGSTDVNDGEWHHVAGVYDGSMVYLYVDGYLDGLEASRNGSGAITINSYDLYIGENAEKMGRSWNGLVDDARIYNAALTASEVAALVVQSIEPSIEPVAHWKLDESTGIIASDSTTGGLYPGILSRANSPTWDIGKIAGALSFHGRSDYVDCDNAPDFNITDQITIAAWVNITTVPRDWAAIVTKGDSAWRISTVQSERRFHFAVTGGPDFKFVNGDITVLADEWHHVVGTYDGADICLYIDGTEDIASPVPYVGNVSTNSYNVYIGGNAETQNEGYRSWNGLIDDVAVWNRALDLHEIQWLYNSGLGNPVWSLGIIYVDDDAPGDPWPGDPDLSDPNEDGSWEHPFDAIQEGVDAAETVATVVVRDGTYMGTGNSEINLWGRAITVQSQNGPENCIIDCQGFANAFIFNSFEDNNSVVDGFTITNGCACGSVISGGGISCVDSSPTIANCIITNNTALYNGGGIYCHSSSPTIINCTISNNSPDGIRMDYSIARIVETVHVVSNNLTGDGTLEMEPNAVLDINDSMVSCNIAGTGTVQIPVGKELIIEEDAIIDLGHETDPNANGKILCNGLLRLRDDVSVIDTKVYVTRASFEDNTTIFNNVINTESVAPYGQFFVNDNVMFIGNEIQAKGDRYIDLDPSVFMGEIQNNRIYVTIPEGQNKTDAGLFEVRGQDMAEPPCEPNEFFCQLGPNTIPDFNMSSWTIERLTLPDGAKVTLTNRNDFQPPYDSGGKDEVLYVRELILGPNSILKTAFNRVYYETLEQDPTAQIISAPLLGFSLDDMSLNDTNEFLIRAKTNNFNHPENPDYTRIHVERVEGLEPDPNGVMRIRNLLELDPGSPNYGRMINARTKGLFAKAIEDRILVRFEYLFETLEPGAELAIYLSDVPELLEHDDPNRSEHYLEVGRLPVPLADRPGSADSRRFGMFQKYVSRGHLNFIKGMWVELELIEPSASWPLYLDEEGLEPMSSGDTSALIDNWGPEVHCDFFWWCLDITWDDFVNEVDFLTVVGQCGFTAELLPDASNSRACLDGAFSGDGFVDPFDIMSWDWTLNSEDRQNLCEGIPINEGVASESTTAGVFQDFGERELLTSLPSSLSDLLIIGKRRASDGPTKLEDRLYVYDNNSQYAGWSSPASDHCNIRLVKGPEGELYRINSEEGVTKLEDTNEVTIIPPGDINDINEPRYDTSATVYIGIQNEGEDSVGRPILDIAFDDANYVYVVPVVVEPNTVDPNTAYVAAAKLQLLGAGNPPYQVVKLYDDPCTFNPDDSDNPNLSGLREIEVDVKGNVYVINVHANNESDILWKYDPNGTVITRLDLGDPNSVNYLPAPIGMHVSDTTEMLYLASAQYNLADVNSTLIYGFSTESLTLERSITINDMHHVTSITEEPMSGSLWVAGFNMKDIPQFPNPGQLPFYLPYLAEVPYDSNSVQAVCISDSNSVPGNDLAMPMSVIWTRTVKCGGADIDRNGDVTFVDFAVFALAWLNELGDAKWNPDCNVSIPAGNSIDTLDLAVLAEHWLETGCLN